MDVLKIKDSSGNWITIPAVGPESLIPAPPTQDGTYTLVVDLSDGDIVYHWESTGATIPELSSNDADIKINGTQSAGTSLKAARADHVHPTDTSRASASDVSALQTAATGKVLYLTSIACSATTGNFVSYSNSAITADHVLAECVFANPSAITTDVTWTTASGNLKLNGTCTTATTCNVVLIKKDN